MKWMYYLHTNGSIIGKNPAFCEPQDWESDFVKKVWDIDTEDRFTAWQVILESISMGADRNRIDALIKNWNCTLNDVCNLINDRRDPTQLMRTGLRIFLKRYHNMEMKELAEFCAERWKEDIN